MFKIIVTINNFIIKKLVKKVDAKDIAILGSRCLQLSSCEKKVTDDITNCVSCGKCTIKDIVCVMGEYNINNVCIATGGTLARRFVKQHKPKLVIAVACERELAMGILGVLPYKSYGVILDQPCGPCKDTVFRKDELKNAIEQFILI